MRSNADYALFCSRIAFESIVSFPEVLFFSFLQPTSRLELPTARDTSPPDRY